MFAHRADNLKAPAGQLECGPRHGAQYAAHPLVLRVCVRCGIYHTQLPRCTVRTGANGGRSHAIERTTRPRTSPMWSVSTCDIDRNRECGLEAEDTARPTLTRTRLHRSGTSVAPPSSRTRWRWRPSKTHVAASSGLVLAPSVPAGLLRSALCAAQAMPARPRHSHDGRACRCHPPWCRTSGQTRTRAEARCPTARTWAWRCTPPCPRLAPARRHTHAPRVWSESSGVSAAALRCACALSDGIGWELIQFVL